MKGLIYPAVMMFALLPLSGCGHMDHQCADHHCDDSCDEDCGEGTHASSHSHDHGNSYYTIRGPREFLYTPPEAP